MLWRIEHLSLTHHSPLTTHLSASRHHGIHTATSLLFMIPVHILVVLLSVRYLCVLATQGIRIEIAPSCHVFKAKVAFTIEESEEVAEVYPYSSSFFSDAWVYDSPITQVFALILDVDWNLCELALDPEEAEEEGLEMEIFIYDLADDFLLWWNSSKMLLDEGVVIVDLRHDDIKPSDGQSALGSEVKATTQELFSSFHCL